MQIHFNRTVSRPFLIGFIILGGMLVTSFGLRQQDFARAAYSPNMEATYHVLLTISALQGSPAKHHWYLPTITLGGNFDKGIPWGATVPTSTEDYIYTSFTPPGFLVPYALFSAFRIAPSVKNLATFNSVLGATVSIVLFCLLWRVLKFVGYSEWVSVGGALAGSSIGIFSNEVLQSHGLAYWSQCLYQLLLVAGLWWVFRYLSLDKEQARKRGHYAAAILAATFLGALTEWTGYLFNLGLASLFWLGVDGTGTSKRLSIQIVLASVAAGLLTLAHYGLAVGFRPTIQALLDRFLERDTSSGNFVGLIQGYSGSFGLFILILAAVLVTHFFSNDKEQAKVSERNKLLFLFLAASIPLIENIVMMEHAQQYSYDRLKFIFPAALILSIQFSRQSIKGRSLLMVAVILASVHGYSSYTKSLRTFERWAAIDQTNKDLARRIADAVDTRCAVFLSNASVRGYANLLFNRGIFEHKSYQDSIALMTSRDACASVYLEGDDARSYWKYRSKNITRIINYTGMPMYDSAVITYRDGSVRELKSQQSIWEKYPVTSDFFVSDDNWNNGTARKWAGFYVPNAEEFVREYRPGRFVILANKDVRTISRVESHGVYLNIFVDGAPLNPEETGLPSSHTVADSNPPR
jgi:hypothetical protein